MTSTEIKQFFAGIDLKVSITELTDGSEMHTIEYQEGRMPAHRLPALLEHYFGTVEPIEFGACLVFLDGFKAEGYGYTGVCERCGCSDHDACMDEPGEPCYWVNDNLCSACATGPELNALYAAAASETVAVSSFEIEPLPTDREFTDSPDTGWPECICSDCGNMIKESEMPLRAFNPEKNTEYRYCESCQEKRFGIKYAPRVDDDFDDWMDQPHPYVPEDEA